MTHPRDAIVPVDATVEALEKIATSLSPTAADGLELSLTGRAGEYTRFADDRIHQPQSITELQIMVRAVCDGHAFRTSTSDLRRLPHIAAGAAQAAQQISRTARPGTARLPDGLPAPLTQRTPLWFETTMAFDDAARVSLAHHAMTTAHSSGGESAGMFGRATVQQIVVSSAGTRRAMLATEATGSLTVTIGDGSSHWTDVSRAAGRLHAAHAVDTTIEQAAACRHPEPIAPGEYTAVLGTEAAAEMLQFLPAFGFSGDLAANGVGVCAAPVDTMLASPLVTIADDGTADVGLPTPFDLEGVAKQRVPMIDKGRVGQPVTDTATAARLGTTSTGHAHVAREETPRPCAANIIMAGGVDDEQALIAGVDHGVYIQRFWYTRVVDPAASRITGVTRDACYRIEHGKLGRAIPGMRFTQSVFDFLRSVDGIGRTLQSQPIPNVWSGVSSAPAIRGHAFRLGFSQGSEG